MTDPTSTPDLLSEVGIGFIWGAFVGYLILVIASKMMGKIHEVFLVFNPYRYNLVVFLTLLVWVDSAHTGDIHTCHRNRNRRPDGSRGSQIESPLWVLFITAETGGHRFRNREYRGLRGVSVCRSQWYRRHLCDGHPTTREPLSGNCHELCEPDSVMPHRKP